MPSRRRSSAVPRVSHTVSSLSPNPCRVSSSATAGGVSPSALSTSSLRPSPAVRSTVWVSSPVVRTTSVSSADQPIRARASATDDTDGRMRTRPAPNRRTRVLPIPASSGSPLASTPIRPPPCVAISSSSAGSSGLGQATLR